MSASPFGRFAEAGAVAAAILVILAWLLSIATVIPKDDNLTFLAISAVMLLLGQRSTTNGAAKIASAANLRLDAIGAPSADVAASRVAAATNATAASTANGTANGTPNG